MPGLGLGSDRLNAARFVRELVTNCLDIIVDLNYFWIEKGFVIGDGKVRQRRVAHRLGAPGQKAPLPT